MCVVIAIVRFFCEKILIYISFTGIKQKEKTSEIFQGSDRGKEAIRVEDETR